MKLILMNQNMRSSGSIILFYKKIRCSKMR